MDGNQPGPERPQSNDVSGGGQVDLRSSAPVAAAERVLLVDDDPVVRLVTAAALAQRGWRVIEADSAPAALAVFDRHPPEVVVLDALMPDVDGFTACEQLRRRPAGAHVPILMLTGLDDEASIARAYEAGATDFFVKTSSQWTLLSERLRYLIRAARTREELAESQAKLTKAQRIARLGSWEWDVSRRWVAMSAECYAILGLQPEQDGLADWLLWSRLLPADRGRARQSWCDAQQAGGQLTLECRIARPDGKLRTVLVEAELERDAVGVVVSAHGVMQDITERKQAEDQIRHLANFDPLTGLPNRRHFRDQLQSALHAAAGNGARAAVLFIDVDRFKQVNDTLGHQHGDELLREVSRRLSHALRALHSEAVDGDGDAPTRRGPSLLLGSPAFGPAARGGAAAPPAAVSSVARVGGDEFVVLLTPLADEQTVEQACLRLLDVVRQPIDCTGHEFFVTASIGVATFPQHGADADTLLRKADVAMYTVKAAGRNGWRTFDDEMNTIAARRWRIENGLHRALDRKELVLHYQPKVDVTTGAIVGAEALLRWQREDQLVLPSEFIAAAEETGLIVPITEWLIGEVCRQLLAWEGVGIRLPVSINVSSRHVQRANLLAPIQSALAASGADARLLELEITETALMHNLEGATPLFAALKRLGVSISIDDFGTGYSSLAYLKRLPIDTLKIDRSFVRDLESSSDNEAIVAAIIAMSSSLKLRVVAEGVETRGQMKRLFELGCRLMQGFLFARALPAEEFAQLAAPGAPARDWRVQARADDAAAGPALPSANARRTDGHDDRPGATAPAAAPAPSRPGVTAGPAAEPAASRPHTAPAVRGARRFVGGQ